MPSCLFRRHENNAVCALYQSCHRPSRSDYDVMTGEAKLLAREVPAGDAVYA